VRDGTQHHTAVSGTSAGITTTAHVTQSWTSDSRRHSYNMQHAGLSLNYATLQKGKQTVQKSVSCD